MLSSHRSPRPAAARRSAAPESRTDRGAVVEAARCRVLWSARGRHGPGAGARRRRRGVPGISRRALGVRPAARGQDAQGVGCPCRSRCRCCPALDHEAKLHEGIPPHAAAYIEDIDGGGLHEVGLRTLAARGSEVDVVSTAGEHTEASHARLVERLRRRFPRHRIVIDGPSWLRGDRRVWCAPAAPGAPLREVLTGRDFPALSRAIDELRIVGSAMEKQSRVASWSVRTVTGPLLALGGFLSYQVLDMLSGRIGPVAVQGLQYLAVGVLGGGFPLPGTEGGAPDGGGGPRLETLGGVPVDSAGLASGLRRRRRQRFPIASPAHSHGLPKKQQESADDGVDSVRGEAERAGHAQHEQQPRSSSRRRDRPSPRWRPGRATTVADRRAGRTRPPPAAPRRTPGRAASWVDRTRGRSA